MCWEKRRWGRRRMERVRLCSLGTAHLTWALRNLDFLNLCETGVKQLSSGSLLSSLAALSLVSRLQISVFGAAVPGTAWRAAAWGQPTTLRSVACFPASGASPGRQQLVTGWGYGGFQRIYSCAPERISSRSSALCRAGWSVPMPPFLH